MTADVLSLCFNRYILQRADHSRDRILLFTLTCHGVIYNDFVERTVTFQSTAGSVLIHNSKIPE